jgi:TolA-binding protein
VAATYFLQNYQKDPNGARAPDSLLFLAESMIALKDNTRACRALAEFGDKYSALAMGRLQDQYGKDRKQAACK